MWQRRSPICGAVHDSASPAAATPGQSKTVNPKQNKRKASSFDCETKDGDAAAAAQKRKLDDMPATFEQAAAEEERRVPTPAAESDDEELTCERHEQQAANTPVPSTPEHTYEVPTTANAKAPSCTNNNKNNNNINQGLINLKTLQKLIDLCLTRLFLPQQLATPLSHESPDENLSSSISCGPGCARTTAKCSKNLRWRQRKPRTCANTT